MAEPVAELHETANMSGGPTLPRAMAELRLDLRARVHERQPLGVWTGSGWPRCCSVRIGRATPEASAAHRPREPGPESAGPVQGSEAAERQRGHPGGGRALWDTGLVMGLTA